MFCLSSFFSFFSLPKLLCTNSFCWTANVAESTTTITSFQVIDELRGMLYSLLCAEEKNLLYLQPVNQLSYFKSVAERITTLTEAFKKNANNKLNILLDGGF